jgi:hypothetical protein
MGFYPSIHPSIHRAPVGAGSPPTAVGAFFFVCNLAGAAIAFAASFVRVIFVFNF